MNRFYLVVKVSQGNRALAQKVTWQGLIVKKQGDGNFALQFFSPSSVPDHMMAEEEGEGEDAPEIDFGSGFTAAQIAGSRKRRPSSWSWISGWPRRSTRSCSWRSATGPSGPPLTAR